MWSVSEDACILKLNHIPHTTQFDRTVTVPRIGAKTMMHSALYAQRRVPTVSARPQRAAVKVTAMKQPSIQHVKKAFAKEHPSPIDSVVTYVSEAFSQIFRTNESQVPWSGTSFSGRIPHHENASIRNRSMNPYQKKNMVVQAIPVPVDEHATGGARTNFVVDSIGRVLGGRVDETSDEPKKFYSTGYTGKKYGSRRVKREVNRVSRY